MERCDFYSVMKIINGYVSENQNQSQLDLIIALFSYFTLHDDNADFDFDNGKICRWINGQLPISPKVAAFYCSNKKNREHLSIDIEENILSILYDTNMAAKEIYELVSNDISISEKKKQAICKLYPCKNVEDTADFICSVIIFCMERKFVKRDTKLLTTSGTRSPIVSGYIFGNTAPMPCRYFCGRDNELEKLHETMKNHGKIFIHGIPGIGKSEFIKAYAKTYKKEYTNILYFSYNGSLVEMISNIDFSDDTSLDSPQDRFTRHNRFLRSLKDDTFKIFFIHK